SRMSPCRRSVPGLMPGRDPPVSVSLRPRPPGQGHSTISIPCACKPPLESSGTVLLFTELRAFLQSQGNDLAWAGPTLDCGQLHVGRAFHNLANIRKFERFVREVIAIVDADLLPRAIHAYGAAGAARLLPSHATDVLQRNGVF